MTAAMSGRNLRKLRSTRRQFLGCGAVAVALLCCRVSLAAGPAMDEALIADAHRAAEWIAKALNQSGYRADFSAESLAEIERFFVEHSKDGRPIPGGRLSDRTGPRLFAVGAYVGEVIRRAGGGQWYVELGDPQGEVNIEVRFPDGSRIWPMQRVIKRLKNGPEENIHDYGRLVITSLKAE
jgi:hypothetical protein